MLCLLLCLSASENSDRAVSYDRFSRIVSTMVGDIPRMERLFEWLQSFHWGSGWTRNSGDLSSARDRIKNLLDEESDDVFSDDSKDEVVIIPRATPQIQTTTEVDQNVPNRRSAHRRILFAKLTLIAAPIVCAYLIFIYKLRPSIHFAADPRDGPSVEVDSQPMI
jgi:hypothetical protein